MALNIDPTEHRGGAPAERRELEADGRAGGGRPRHRDGRRRRSCRGTARAPWRTSSWSSPAGSSAWRSTWTSTRSAASSWASPTRSKRATRSSRPARILSMPVGDGFLGRVVDALGRPLDDKGPIAVDRAPQPGGAGAERRLAPAGEGAAVHGHLGDRRDDGDRAWPAPADHRRPPDRQDRRRRRRDHRAARALGHRPRGEVHLRGHRAEGVHGVGGRRDAPRERRARLHRRRERLGRRPGAVPVHRAVRGRRARRVLDVRGRQRADRLRRPVEAGGRLPRDLAPAPPPARPRGLPGRRVLPALPAARARREALRRARRRLPHRAARSSRRRAATSPRTSRRTSSRSPTGRSSSSPSCSSPASVRRSTSASRCRASAATPRSRR